MKRINSKYFIRQSSKISNVGVMLLSIFLFTTCESSSTNLKTILKNPIATMQLYTAQEIERSYNDKNKTFGKPVYARLDIHYVPLKQYSKSDVFNEIIDKANKYGWKENSKRYSNNKQEGWYKASLSSEASLALEVLYTENRRDIKLTLIIH